MRQFAKTIIVDDEPAAVQVISALLQQFAPDFQVTGVATNGIEAVQLITEHKPDIVFLDVDMPVMNGLQVMEKFPANNFSVIFTTGSDAYALNALKMKAVDYLLKPIDPADFILAVEKLREELKGKVTGDNIRMQFPTQNGIIFLYEHEILRVEGMGSYCQVHALNGEKITVSKNIGQLEQKLSERRFFRCHNSHIVNLEQVTRFLHKDQLNFVVMADGTTVEVSRRNKDGLLTAMEQQTR